MLVDTGGKIDRKTQRILNCCTHAIIVTAKPEEFCRWRGAIEASEVALIALVESVLEQCCDVVGTDPLHVRLGKLERGTTGTVPDALIRAVCQAAEIQLPDSHSVLGRR
ncbi:MAG: hypothetical protein RMK00_05440 [Bacteroidota bacterium]|nr:hypothetical protein [Bacteroidota bacterium]